MQNTCPSHCSGGSRTPFPHAAPARVVVVVAVVVVVVAQPPETQASQQLDMLLMQALPPGGGVQVLALLFTLHVLAPVASISQQVTAPRVPHVEFPAQPMTTSAHSLLNAPAATAWFVTSAAQRRYAPWVLGLAQSHCSATCARVSATACASSGLSPQDRKPGSAGVGRSITRREGSDDKPHDRLPLLVLARRFQSCTIFVVSDAGNTAAMSHRSQAAAVDALRTGPQRSASHESVNTRQGSSPASRSVYGRRSV